MVGFLSFMLAFDFKNAGSPLWQLGLVAATAQLGRVVRGERDEAGQAAYLRELLEIFDAEGVDSAFVFAFALSSHPMAGQRGD
jgi:hypothetical protein